MRPYIAAFRIRLIMGLQYRAAAWAGVATQFFFGFVYVMIFDAFYRSSNRPPPMPFEQLVSYLWLQQAFLAIIALWYTDSELLQSITSGQVAYELARPTNLYALWFVRLAAQKISSAAMRCGPILLVALLLPAPYNLRLPPSPQALLLFVVALALALCVCVAVAMFIYILTFITLSPSGARLLVISGADFLSGTIIPLPMMPEALQRVLDVLPFRYTADFPLRVWSGNIASRDALAGICVQLAWLALLVALGSWSLRCVLRRAVIQGG